MVFQLKLKERYNNSNLILYMKEKFAINISLHLAHYYCLESLLMQKIVTIWWITKGWWRWWMQCNLLKAKKWWRYMGKLRNRIIMEKWNNMVWLLYLFLSLMMLFFLKRKLTRKKKRDHWNDDRPGEIIDFDMYVQKMQRQSKKPTDGYGKPQEMKSQKVIPFPKNNIK